MTLFSIAKTLVGSARGTGLHRSVVWRSLSWCLLASLLLRADCHSAAGTVDVAGLGCAEGTDHDSIDWVVPGTSA